MATPRVLIVDDQRDVLRLLRSSLDSLGYGLDVVEAPSGEEALLVATRYRIDLLVTDYKLPGMNGVELMAKVRSRNPDVQTVLITALPDRRVHDELRNAGAAATFDKPIPMSDFLQVVERTLGLKRTAPLPPEPPQKEAIRVVEDARIVEASQMLEAVKADAVKPASSLSDLLSHLRKQVGAQAVYLVSDRGRAMERAGDLYDSNMEDILFSAVMSVFSAGQKVARAMRVDDLSHYHVINGQEHDLIIVPASPLYALIVGGKNVAAPQRVAGVVQVMISVRADIERSLRSIGMPTAPAESSDKDIPAGISAAINVPTQDIASLLTKQAPPPVSPQAAPQVSPRKVEADAFWEAAVEKHGNPPLKPDHISYEQAKQLGIAPSRGTKPLKPPTK